MALMWEALTPCQGNYYSDILGLKGASLSISLAQLNTLFLTAIALMSVVLTPGRGNGHSDILGLNKLPTACQDKLLAGDSAPKLTHP